jgi:hypothetical protein
MAFDIELLALELEGTAQSRRQKAAKFPDDGRHLKAADLLERLAEEVPQLKGSALHAELSRALDRHFDPNAVEDEYEMRNSIGFLLHPASGAEYLREVIGIYEKSARAFAN